MTVFVYVNSSKPVGDPDRTKVFAHRNAGVAFEYWYWDEKGCRPLVARNPVIQRTGGKGIWNSYIRSDAHGMDFGRRDLSLCGLCRCVPGVSLLVFPRPQAESRC
jgi:hypothetical protein